MNTSAGRTAFPSQSRANGGGGQGRLGPLHQRRNLKPVAGTCLASLPMARTASGASTTYRISNLDPDCKLVEMVVTTPIDKILPIPTWPSAIGVTLNSGAGRRQIKRWRQGPRQLVVLDLRAEPEIMPSTASTSYALFEQCNISIHVLWGPGKRVTVFATGKVHPQARLENRHRRPMLKYRARRPRGRGPPAKSQRRAARCSVSSSRPS